MPIDPEDIKRILDKRMMDKSIKSTVTNIPTIKNKMERTKSSLSDIDRSKIIGELAPGKQHINKAVNVSEMPEKPGFARKALNKTLGMAEWLGNKYDRSITAPVRSAIDAGLQLKNPAMAWLDQFNEDPRKAPTGQEIMKNRIGVSDEEAFNTVPGLRGAAKTTFDPRPGTGWPTDRTNQELPTYDALDEVDALKFSPAGVAGLGLDILADPTNLIPGRTIGKVVGGLGAKAAKGGSWMGAKGLDSLMDTGVFSRMQNVAETGASKAGEAISKTFGKSKHATDYPNLEYTAAKNGINMVDAPAALKFGEHSVISRMERKVREGLHGQDHMDRYVQFHNEVQDALKRKISKLSEGVSSSLSDAGRAIRKGYKTAEDAMFKTIDHSYATISSFEPRATIQPDALKKLDAAIVIAKNKAQEKLKHAGLSSQKEVANQILNFIKNLERDIGKTVLNKEGKPIRFLEEGSLKNIALTMQQLGEAAYKVDKMDVKPDVKTLRSLYKACSNAFIETTEVLYGKKYADELRKNNKTMSEFFKLREPIYEIINNAKVFDDKIFQRLILNGSETQLKTIKSMIPPEQLSIIKSELIENMIPRNAEGNIFYNQFTKKLEDRKVREKLNVFFSPKEIEEIKELNRLGDRAGTEFLSTSGTGASAAFENPEKAAKDYIFQATKLDDMIKEANKTPRKITKFQRGRKEGYAKASQVSSVQRTNREGRPEEKQR
jgi:hypothetical protein